MFAIPYKWVIGVVGMGLLVFAFHLYVKHKEQIGYAKAQTEYKLALLDAEKHSRAIEQEMSVKLENARNEAVIKAQEIDKLNRDLSDVSNRLRNTITASKSKLATDSTEALRVKADTALTVFGECQARYGEMAETADRHALDVEMLLKAWPTN